MAKQVDAAILAARVTIQKTLSECKREIESARERGRKLRAARYVVLQPILTKVHMILSDVSPRQKYVTLSTYGDMYVSLNSQDSLKTPVVIELLEYFNGLTDNVKTSDWVTDLMTQREFKFKVGETTIIVSVDVKSDSPSCRKVVTGTKTEERKTYAIVCD